MMHKILSTYFTQSFAFRARFMVLDPVFMFKGSRDLRVCGFDSWPQSP
jgi:hypothetical protein